MSLRARQAHRLRTLIPIAVALLVLCSLVVNRNQKPWSPLPAYAVTPTAVVTASPVVGPVSAIGVNTGNNDDFYGPGAFMSNYFANPGFEPPSLGKLIIVGSGATSSTFTDTNDSANNTQSNWIGAIGTVRTGMSAGDTFTITGYTNGGSNPSTYTFGSCKYATGGSISCPTL